MALIRIVNYRPGTRLAPAEAGIHCRALEEGHVLLFPQTPFKISGDERAFLLDQQQSRAAYHKNIAYRPAGDRVTGYRRGSGQDAHRLREVLAAYSRRVMDFAQDFLTPYSGHWRPDLASFRPQEEQGRELPLRARNDLIHVDAFPRRPSRGGRILRIFTNIHPTQSRVWVTSDGFDTLAARYGRAAGLPPPARLGGWWHSLARSAPILRNRRTPYDRFMLRFHNYLKESREFQESCPKYRMEFPPGSTWMAFTDMVSHSVQSGQFALEQTFIVSRTGLLLPHLAPVQILEELCGCALV